MARAGDAPNVARLIEMGTAYEWGAISSFPTVTLANHTSILTGRFPGHHGILHNAWYDRARGEQVITNSMATWPWAMSHLVDGVETLHTPIHRAFPGAFTASVNEPCDVGADYSTFEFFRNGDVSAIPDGPEGIPHATERFVRPSKDYAWSTTVDHLCVDQAVSIWAGEYRDQTYPHPKFMWCNFTLTDAAFHEGGPYSEIAAASVRDSDARLGDVLDAVERAGRVRRHRVRRRRRPRHGGDEPLGAGRLGRRAPRRRDQVPRRGLLLPVPRRGVARQTVVPTALPMP